MAEKLARWFDLIQQNDCSFAKSTATPFSATEIDALVADPFVIYQKNLGFETP